LFVTHIGNLNLNATAAWLPLLLLLVHRALTCKSSGWAAGAGAVLAMTALAGHGQMLLFAALLLVLYVLYRLVVDWRCGWQHELHTLGLMALIIAVGMGGAALTLLPAYEMAGHTGRGHLPYEGATRYSLPPQALIGLLAPGFYGRGQTGFWAPWDRVEVGYVGVAALVLALLGLVVACRRWIRQNPVAGFPFSFFVFLVPLAFLLAMGRYTPFYHLLYRYAPTFDQVRVPARLIVLADLGLAVLAAYGLDQLLRGRVARLAKWMGFGALGSGGVLLGWGVLQAPAIPPPDRVEQAVMSIVVAVVLLGLSGVLVLLARRWRWAVWLLPLLLATDLIALGATLEAEPNDPTLGFLHEDVAAFLHQDTAPFRIEVATGAWQPDAALVHGLYDAGGVYNPLELAPYQAYRWAVGERGAPLYNLLGVKYVLAGKDEPPGDERFVPVYAENPQIDVYLNTVALPRAFLVYRSQVVNDHAAAWEAIHAPGFDPMQVVVLEQGGSVETDPGEGERDVSFTRYGLNEVELAVRTPVDGFLVLSDVYYPGWRAMVDDLPAEVLRADYVFRAVAVPPGEHVVRMVFDPWTWRVGLTASVVTWVGLVVWAGVLWVRRSEDVGSRWAPKPQQPNDRG
jgi:hypothetical protein